MKKYILAVFILGVITFTSPNFIAQTTDNLQTLEYSTTDQTSSQSEDVLNNVDENTSNNTDNESTTNNDYFTIDNEADGDCCD